MNYVGFKPYSHQKAVIDALRDAKGTSRVVCVKSSRQKGKSYLISGMLLYYAINYKKTKNFCISPTLKQAKAVYKTIMDAIDGSGIVRSSNATDLEITLVNKSIICFRSAEQKSSLRGYSCHFLCVDEAAFIGDDEFFGLILPWTNAHKAPILMTSTPFVKSGFFWKYFNFGLEGKNNTVTIDWCDPAFKEDIDKILPPEKLEEYRQFLPSKQFRSEYLGEWLDDDGTVFLGFRERASSGLFISPSDKLFVGIDWASGEGGDYTVVSILNHRAEQVALHYWNNVSPVAQIDKIAAILQPIEKQIVVIEPELNSIGSPYTDLLRTRLQRSTQSKINGFITTNSTKNDIVTQLQVAFENGDILIQDDPHQLRELGIYSAEYNPKTKVVTYNAPQGLHDDTCIALMLSYDALKNNKNRGHYIIR